MEVSQSTLYAGRSAEDTYMASLSESLDHFYPERSDHPYWTESSWFSWAIPHEGLCGLFWNHFRPNMNCLIGGPAVWDASGQHVWDFPFFDFQTMRLLPEGRWGVDYDKYDFVTPWSMSIRMVEPLKCYRLGYSREGFELDLVFTAIAPPNIMGAPAVDELKSAFRLHFEQPGRIRGTIKLDGQTRDVDCYSIRDGGHGPRFLESARAGAYAWSTADDGTGWHILAPNAADGPVAQIIGGYILRNGEMSPIVEGTRRVLRRAGPRPDVVEINARDQLGRELHAVGRAQTPAEVMLFPDRGQWWTLFQWDYDGIKSANGEDQEYYGIHEFRRWHRAGPAVWQTR
jgi:hypothetical protein